MNIKASTRHKPEGKILYITSIGIIPKYRKRGFGIALMNKIIELAKNKKLDYIYLRTKNAKRFYEKINFSFIGYDVDLRDKKYNKFLKKRTKKDGWNSVVIKGFNVIIENINIRMLACYWGTYSYYVADRG